MPGPRTWACTIHLREPWLEPFPCPGSEVRSRIPAPKNHHAIPPAIIAHPGLGGAGLQVSVNRLPHAFAPLPDDPLGTNRLCETPTEQNKRVASFMVHDAMATPRKWQGMGFHPVGAIQVPDVVEVVVSIVPPRAAANQVCATVTGVVNELMMGPRIRSGLSVRRVRQ